MSLSSFILCTTTSPLVWNKSHSPGNTCIFESRPAWAHGLFSFLHPFHLAENLCGSSRPAQLHLPYVCETNVNFMSQRHQPRLSHHALVQALPPQERAPCKYPESINITLSNPKLAPAVLPNGPRSCSPGAGLWADVTLVTSRHCLMCHFWFLPHH